MAASRPVSENTRIVGVLVPGDGRLRFCATDVHDLRQGDWIVVNGPLADEPGQVLFTADRVAHSLPTTTCFIARRLPPSEQAGIPASLSRAVEMLDSARQAVSGLDPVVEIFSLRFSLDGQSLLLRAYSTTGGPDESLAETLSRVWGLPVTVEWSDTKPRSFGSLGWIGSTGVERDLVLARLEIDGTTDATFANGWPRLGQTVRTPHGTGQLRSVSVRHNVAIVRLDSGEEVEVPVGELRGPGE